MKTGVSAAAQDAAPIVQAVQGAPDGSDEAGPDALARARSFAEPLLQDRLLDTGEPALPHADGVAAILQAIGAAPSMRAAAYLVYAGDFLQRPEEVVAKAFGPGHASLVTLTRKLVQIQRAAREAQVGPEARAEQTERVRKMLLAFSRDLRVVLLRLASRLQTLCWYAASKQPCPVLLARETQEVFAPLANRLGIWQIKWELEDLAFRFLQPQAYKQVATLLAAESMQVFAPLASRLGIWQIKWELEDLSFRFLEPESYRNVARLLDETRVEREKRVDAFRRELAAQLQRSGLKAEVQGRPKHLYSIWK